MTAGLPGTGIGGLFYILLVVLLPLRELLLTITGRSSLARWRSILKLAVMSAGIVLALLGESLLLKAGFSWLSQAAPKGSAIHQASVVAMNGVVPWLAAAPFIILLVLLSSMHVLRMWVCRQKPVQIITPRPLGSSQGGVLNQLTERAGFAHEA